MPFQEGPLVKFALWIQGCMSTKKHAGFKNGLETITLFDFLLPRTFDFEYVYVYQIWMYY